MCRMLRFEIYGPSRMSVQWNWFGGFWTNIHNFFFPWNLSTWLRCGARIFSNEEVLHREWCGTMRQLPAKRIKKNLFGFRLISTAAHHWFTRIALRHRNEHWTIKLKSLSGRSRWHSLSIFFSLLFIKINKLLWQQTTDNGLSMWMQRTHRQNLKWKNNNNKNLFVSRFWDRPEEIQQQFQQQQQ